VAKLAAVRGTAVVVATDEQIHTMWGQKVNPIFFKLRTVLVILNQKKVLLLIGYIDIFRNNCMQSNCFYSYKIMLSSKLTQTV